MTYPATNFEEAVSNTITSSDQLHQVINGSVTDTVTTDSGEIPSVRKALTDNMYFVEAIPWVQGGNETVFNQLRTFTDNVVYWAPNATVSDPVPMGATPDGDSNWTLAPVSLTEDKIRQVSSEIANAGDSQLAGGKIWPIDATLIPLGSQSTSVPIGISRLKVDTGIAGGELLFLWVPSGDFESTPRIITDISANSEGGYSVTTTTGTFEFIPSKFESYREDLNVAGWGGEPGGVDATSAFMAAHDFALQDQYVKAPAETYKVNLLDWTRGMTSNGAILQRFSLGEILQLGVHDKHTLWDYTYLEHLTLDGVDGAETLVTMGDVAVTPTLVGRYVFNDVMLIDAERGIHKKAGNIGNTYNNTSWTRCDYGVYAEPHKVDKMHVGADTYNQCHFEAADKCAMYYTDNTGGAGQLTLNDCIMESNPGFGLFVRIQNPDIEFSPPVVINNLWLEANHTLPTVILDDIGTQIPRDMRFDNVSSVHISGTFIKSIELLKTNVIADNCRTDSSAGYYDIVMDDQSTLIFKDANIQGIANSAKPFYESIKSISGGGINGLFSGRMPNRAGRAPSTGNLVYTLPMNDATPVSFSGINTVPIAGGFNGTHHHRLTIPPSTTANSSPVVSASDGKFYMWSMMFRILSGELSAKTIGGGSGSFGDISANPFSDAWSCAVGMCVGAGQKNARISLVNSSSSSTIVEMAEMQMLEFDSESEMLYYLRSMAFTQQ